MRQRLVGEWVGRAETAEERILREWPVSDPDPEDPELVAALADAPTTDLELADPVAVVMKLEELGGASFALGDGEPLTGRWIVTPLDARRAQLDLVADRDDETSERRRYDLEFLKTGEGFVLREAGSDRRFGRLLFNQASN